MIDIHWTKKQKDYLNYDKEGLDKIVDKETFIKWFTKDTKILEFQKEFGPFLNDDYIEIVFTLIYKFLEKGENFLNLQIELSFNNKTNKGKVEMIFLANRGYFVYSIDFGHGPYDELLAFKNNQNPKIKTQKDLADYLNSLIDISANQGDLFKCVEVVDIIKEICTRACLDGDYSIISW